MKVDKRAKYRASHREEIRRKTQEAYWADPEKSRQRRRELYAQNPAGQLSRARKYKYGISQQEWEKLFLECEGKCQICSSPEEICVDHNHSTGRVRGLLCRKCNAAIGLLKETPELLLKAVEYLRKV